LSVRAAEGKLLGEHELGQARRKKQASRSGIFRLSRLVIVQWLLKDDPKTGSDIRDRMISRIGHNTPVELIDCQSACDVLVAIDTITHEVPAKGIPILHIEAHGGFDEEGNVIGFLGPDGHGGDAVLPWDQLTGPFRALNLATRFNLLVVGAACISEGVLFSIEPNRPLPYVGAVTFRTKVDTRRLRDAMSELYRALLVTKLSLEKSVDHANRELDPETEMLRFSAVPNLIWEAAVDAVTFHDAPAKKEAFYYKAVVNASVQAGQTMSLTQRQVFAHRDDAAPMIIHATLRNMLAYDQFPENEARFGFNAVKLVKRVRQTFPMH
jgi:hypothetical protein